MKNLLCKYLFIVFILFVITSCDENNDDPVSVGVNPIIENVKLKDRWNTESSIQNKVEVWVNDPQGLADIFTVIMSVTQDGRNDPIFADSLYDDGAVIYTNDGDVLAKDGVFSNKFTVDQIDPALEAKDYTFSFVAEDKNHNISTAFDYLVRFGPNSSPTILDITVPDTLYSGFEMEVFQLTFADSNGVDDVTDAWFEIDGFGGITHFYNDGDLNNHGDLFANDSIFTVKLDSTFGAGKQGDYIFDFYVEDSFQERNEIVPERHINIENKVGSIITTNIPDTVIREVVVKTFTITARATDPQGLADIDSVYFVSQASDGSFVRDDFGAIIRVTLRDNGFVEAWGDEIEGDGIFSRILQVTSENVADDYRFHFFCRDLVGQLSAVKIDSISIL